MNKVAKIQRQFTVAELYLQGVTRNEIARQLEIGQGTVSNDIAAFSRTAAGCGYSVPCDRRIA